MIAVEDLQELLEGEINSDWLECRWLNHSDLPTPELPDWCRVNYPDYIICTHAYRMECGLWQPVLYVKGKHQESRECKVDKYWVFFNGGMREIGICQCPECNIVHYQVDV